LKRISDVQEKYAKGDTDTFLEVKSVSFDADTWSATFNDTNQEKANAFKKENIFLCLSLWRYACEPIFFAYGHNPNIGIFLESKMNNRKEGSRSTQSISLQNLVNTYKFTIYSVHKTVEQLYDILQFKKGCKKISKKSIKMIRDF
jgi:hypothetical protein